MTCKNCEKTKRLLRRLEWSGIVFRERWNYPACPICKGVRPSAGAGLSGVGIGHTKRCALAKVIA
jgi:hypothetical protein